MRAAPVRSYLARAFMNAGNSPRSLRACAVAFADLLLALAVNWSRCRAIMLATLGGITRRVVPLRLVTSRKIVSPKSRSRYVCTQYDWVPPTAKSGISRIVDGRVVTTSGKPCRLPIRRSNSSGMFPLGLGGAALSLFLSSHSLIRVLLYSLEFHRVGKVRLHTIISLSSTRPISKRPLVTRNHPFLQHANFSIFMKSAFSS